MQISLEFFRKDFTSKKDFKTAYLKACKWAAQNIISKVEIGETFWRIEKVKDADLPTCRIVLYAMLEDTDITESFCKACKSFHTAFFVNQEFDCNRCKMQAYKKQIQQKLDIKKAYRKEKLKHVLDEE